MTKRITAAEMHNDPYLTMAREVLDTYTPNMREAMRRVLADSASLDLLEEAWGVIANASGGDWTKETPEWQEAAARWRDRYHAILAPEPSDD